MKKVFKIFVLFLISVIIAAGLFIKLDQEGAALFTDNVLRPVLGAQTVTFLEKIFFNTVDKFQQITKNDSGVLAPQFNTTGNSELTDGNLDLTQIPVNHNFKKLPGEGEWKIMQSGISYTFVRPDKDRPYSVVTIAQLDMRKFDLGVVAGTKEPAGIVGNPGPGKVPADIVDRNLLVAAFDGGFQYRDGRYGMIVGNKTYLPLEKDLASIVGYKNGGFKIINYTGQNLGSDIAFVRQNCPILIENGYLSVADPVNKKLWGRTPTTSIYTWRTGIGINRLGNLLFAVGNNLMPTTLAYALKMAGAENAMQLDINPYWVRFNVFNSLGNGKYSSKTLTRDLKDGSSSYLNGYTKDFFYVYRKNP
jgi:hypothetical protein